ncbi:MAG: hypothetical protein JWL59_2707 [Chthoniobacteraceae bacterium]|nr:hypothetical protein [Chthoniobacteraceae bacterium]
MILYAKNTAINSAHQQARIAVMKIEDNIHRCVSVPQLVDSNRAPVTGNGPAAGIAFHRFAGGPYQVSPGNYTGNTITIICSGVLPKVNQRLNIPTHFTECFITAISGSGATRTLTLATSVGNPVNTALNGAEVNITCFTTELLTYTVVGSELRFYPSYNNANYSKLADGITTSKPFQIPVTATGAAYNRFVAAINLSTAEINSTNRGFKSANMFINSQVPYRVRLTDTQ